MLKTEEEKTIETPPRPTRKIANDVKELMTELYQEEIADQYATATNAYLSALRNKDYEYNNISDVLNDSVDFQKQLKGELNTEKVSVSNIASSDLVHIDHKFFDDMGYMENFEKGEDLRWVGPLNANLARAVMIPLVLEQYIEAYPSDEEFEEIGEALDPKLFEYSPAVLNKVKDYGHYRSTRALENPEDRKDILEKLGELGDEIAKIEKSYAANNSTQSYESFGMFHLLPSDNEVCVTATTPGVILPSERNPNLFPDHDEVLQQNRVRPAYFDLLASRAQDLGMDVIYFADEEGTVGKFRDFDQDYFEKAKENLSEFLELDNFELYIGDKNPKMKIATLVEEGKGVAYSVRGGDEDKIIDNLTHVHTSGALKEAEKFREIFQDQIDNASKVKNSDELDDLAP